MAKSKKRKPTAWNRVAGSIMKACRVQHGDSTKDYSKCLSTRMKSASKEMKRGTRARR